MRGWTVIARREVFRRRHLFAIAAGLAVIAVAMPMLPGLSGYPDAEVRAVTATVLALLLGLIVAGVLGADLAGRDLLEGRFGFDFARPVAAIGIWAGRISAALAVLLGCELVALLPALPGELERSTRGMDSVLNVGLFALVFIGLPVLLMLLVHVVGIVVRARTPWVVLDAAASVLTLVAVWLIVRPFVGEVQIRPGIAVGLLLLTGLAIALVAASSVQFVNGRADLAGAHRWQAIVLWLVVATSVAGVGAVAAWVWAIEPHDLTERTVVSVSPNGDWFELWGYDRARFSQAARFLVSATDGRRVRLDAGRHSWQSSVRYSSDGARAAVGRYTRSEVALGVFNLNDDTPAWRSLSLTLAGDHSWFRLSPRGTVLVVRQSDIISAYDVDSGDQMSAFRLPPDIRVQSLVFVGETSARIAGPRNCVDRPDSMAVYDVSLDTGELTEVGERHVPGGRHAVLSADASELFVTAEEGANRTSTTFAIPGWEVVSSRGLQDRAWIRRLRDGRELTVASKPPGEPVELRSSDGRLLASYPVHFDHAMRFGPETDDGRVLMMTGSSSSPGSGCVSILDVDDGSVEPIDCDVYPARGQWFSFRFMQPARRPIDRLVLQRSTGEILTWTPASGEIRTVPGLGAGP